MREVTVEQFMDLIDNSRESEEYVEILDENGNVRVKAMCCSDIWDMLAYRTVNSIKADGNVIQIWLDDEEETNETN